MAAEALPLHIFMHLRGRRCKKKCGKQWQQQQQQAIYADVRKSKDTKEEEEDFFVQLIK
jgi:hypothetical protein